MGGRLDVEVVGQAPFAHLVSWGRVGIQFRRACAAMQPRDIATQNRARQKYVQRFVMNACNPLYRI